MKKASKNVKKEKKEVKSVKPQEEVKEVVSKQKKEVKTKAKKEFKLTQEGIIIMLGIIIILLVVVIVALLIKKGIPLSSNSKVVKDAYAYVGSDNLERCSGLVMYNDEIVTKNTLDNTTKVCLSYNLVDIKGEEIKLDKTDKKTTCSIAEGMVYALDNYEGDICTITKISKEEVHKKYKEIFGEELELDESFQLDNTNVCFYYEDSYYCGLSEKYTYVIGAEPHTYRAIKSAYKKDDELVIYDYFLRIINDECYTSYMTNNKNDKCTSKYDADKDMSNRFMKRYGQVYKHTFKKDGDSYYWVSSEAK